MKKALVLLVALSLIGKVAFAADYIVDFTRIQDFESMRSLVRVVVILAQWSFTRTR